MRHSKSSSKGAVDSDTALPHKQEKSQMKNLNLLLKKLKEKQSAKLVEEKETIKIRAEINKIEIKKSMKLRVGSTLKI